MARFEFKLPDIGEGVTEGEIVSWLVEPGQTIAEDQPMVEVMTDKATVTIAAPRTGRVVERHGAVGEVVQVHSVLVVFELDEAGRAEPERSGENGAAKREHESVASAVGDIREDLPGMQLGAKRVEERVVLGGGVQYFNEKPLATPATRKLARDLGLDLRIVRPTGPFGRVTSEDVRSALSTPAAPARPSSEPPQPSPRAAIEAPPAETPAERAGPEERTPLKGLRKRIFENMARSKQKAAHFTFVEECDVSALRELRRRLKPPASAQGANLTFLPFFVKAVVAALRRHPSLNSTFDESTQEIVTRRYHNIGIATATEAGLVVPVVKNAGERSLLDIAREIERLADDARKNRLKLDDLTGSTFTITSLG